MITWKEEGAAEVKWDLTSNIKVSRGRVAGPGAVDCHTLVLALVGLLTVLNLKSSWGQRSQGHKSALHQANTHPHTPTHKYTHTSKHTVVAVKF